jgi:hypothetical protein
MNQLYAIRAYGGSYDDAWETVKFVTDDLAKGEAYVAKMNAFRDELDEKKKEIYDWNTEWRMANAAPVCAESVDKEYPRWDSKTKVTAEMRAERKRIQDENAIAYQTSMKPYFDWNTRAYEAWMAWQQATYPAEILQGIAENLDDANWDIEPVAWLE